MKIIIVGATGTIGKAVTKLLSARHQIVTAGRKNADVMVDMTDNHSIEKMYQVVGAFDALIATTGSVHFGPLSEFTSEQYQLGLQNKLMGQINLVLMGLRHINAKGSFTLTSGILSDDPICLGSSAAMVNGAINAFVKSAAIEMPNGCRVNAVSPTVLTESLKAYEEYFRGFASAPGEQVALAYSKSVEGAQTGQVFKVW